MVYCRRLHCLYPFIFSLGRVCMCGPSVRRSGKRSVALDLKSKKGVDTLVRLARSADVLVEPFRPGVCAVLIELGCALPAP